MNHLRKAYSNIKDKLQPEERLQSECVLWTYENYPDLFFFHSKNEGYRNSLARTKLALMGVKKGLPDLIFLEPNNRYFGLVLEAKAEYENGLVGKETKEQIQNRKDLTKRGYLCKVFTSLDEYKSIVIDYVAGIPEPVTSIVP